MSCHRILVTGAPASGKAWLAARVHSLTGVPVHDPPDTPMLEALAAEREWLVVARDRARLEEVLPLADLVVIVRTERWLRMARTLLRWASSWGRPGLRGLRKALVATQRWEAAEVPGLRELLGPERERVMHCGSADEVRAVLERILGIAPMPGARA